MSTWDVVRSLIAVALVVVGMLVWGLAWWTFADTFRDRREVLSYRLFAAGAFVFLCLLGAIAVVLGFAGGPP